MTSHDPVVVVGVVVMVVVVVVVVVVVGVAVGVVVAVGAVVGVVVGVVVAGSSVQFIYTSVPLTDLSRTKLFGNSACKI